MALEIRFDVIHRHETEHRHSEFTVSLNRALDFQDIVSQIRLACDPENRLNLCYSPILYTNSEGKQVLLNDDKDSLERFWNAVLKSIERGSKSFNLVIPNTTGGKTEMNARGLDKLNFRDLENLFNAEVDHNGRRVIKNVASKSVTFQERLSPTLKKTEQEFTPQQGMLYASRISGEQVYRLLRDGSQILMPLEDNNFLLLKFSNHTALPSNLTWQNRSPKHYPATYQCEGVLMPAVIENQAHISIPNDVKHILRVCEDNRKKAFSWAEKFKQHARTLQEQRNQLLQAQYHRQSQQFQQQHPTLPQICHPPTLCYPTEMMPQMQDPTMQPAPQKSQTLQNPHGHLTDQREVNPQCAPAANLEDEIPAWFHHQMKNFKEDIIADVQKMFEIHSVKKGSQNHENQQGTEEDILAKNYPSDSIENALLPNVEGWEVVTGFTQNNSNPAPPSCASDCPDQPDKFESDDLQLSKKDLKQESERPLIEYKSPDSSTRTPEDCYDSDSSISLIMDDNVVNEELMNKSQIIEIPRCFVRQLDENDEGTSGRVTVRVTHRKVHKSTMEPEPNAEAVPAPTSPLSACMKIRETDCTDESNSIARSQPEQGKANPANVAGCSNGESSDDVGMESIRRQFWQFREMKSNETDRKDDSNPIARSQPEQGETSTTNFAASGFANWDYVRNAATENAARRRFRQTRKMKSRGTDRTDNSSPISHSQPQQGKAAVPGRSNWKSSDNAGVENARARQPNQAVNILPDTVFEMTNNVFKNVLNSVKIPHSNEVKESVQKVFEESMAAASRLIPNPLYAESVPPSENLNFPSPPKPSTSINVPQKPSASNNVTPPPSNTPASNENKSLSEASASVNDDYSRFDDLPDKMKADLVLLGEMGFLNKGHNLFLLSKYPDDLEKVVESLVNFAVV